MDAAVIAFIVIALAVGGLVGWLRRQPGGGREQAGDGKPAPSAR